MFTYLDGAVLQTVNAYNKDWRINFLGDGSWDNYIRWYEDRLLPTEPAEHHTTIRRSMGFIGLLFNILTLIVISRFKVISRSYKLMAVLAVSDIGYNLLPVIHLIEESYITKKYYSWLPVCQFQVIYHENMIAFGAYVYLMLTIDRFVAVVKALQYRSIMTKTKYIIYTVILLSHHTIVFFISYAFFPNNQKSARYLLIANRLCEATQLIHPIAKYYSVGFISLLVFCNIGLCFALVMYLIIKRFKRKSLGAGGSGSNNLTKATTTLIIASALYAVLYVQLLVIQLIAPGERGNTTGNLENIGNHIFTVNTFINPLIYYFRMSEIRAEFHNLFRCRPRQ